MGSSDTGGVRCKGTPFEFMEDDVPSKPKYQEQPEQYVLDTKGKHRFHGVFTAGYTTDYDNFVGRPDGWTSAILNNTQTKKEQVTKQIPEAMDVQECDNTSMQHPVGIRRPYVWDGVLEWIGRAEVQGERQTVTRVLPCQMSTPSHTKDLGLAVDAWPDKLPMQMLPKSLISKIVGKYMKNTKSVVLHMEQNEALEALIRFMGSKFVGCVHFKDCDIKVMILLYKPEKKAFRGYIPEKQVVFVERLRTAIQLVKMGYQRQVTGARHIPSGMSPNMLASTGRMIGLRAGFFFALRSTRAEMAALARQQTLHRLYAQHQGHHREESAPGGSATATGLYQAAAHSGGNAEWYPPPPARQNWGGRSGRRDGRRAGRRIARSEARSGVTPQLPQITCPEPDDERQRKRPSTASIINMVNSLRATDREQEATTSQSTSQTHVVAEHEEQPTPETHTLSDPAEEGAV